MNAGPASYYLHLQQASSAFTLSDHHAYADIMEALSRGSAVVGFTEVAERQAQLRDACELKGYQLVAGGDVALAVQSIHKLITHGNVPVIPGHKGPAAEGGHGPRGVLFATFQPFGTREHVTAHAAHWVTRKADTGHQQLQLTDELATIVKAHSVGGQIGFWQGDINSPDELDHTPLAKALRRGDLTSCWDELGKWPATHEHATIDVIGSYDPDRRVHCVRARRWPAGFSDHRPVSAWYAVSPARVR